MPIFNKGVMVGHAIAIKDTSGDEVARKILDGTITEYIDSKVSQIGEYAFYKCRSLSKVICENCLSVYGSAFYSCSGLTTIKLDNVKTLSGSQIFSGCTQLISVSFDKLTTIAGTGIFEWCTNLQTVNLGGAYIQFNASALFASCSKLQSFSHESMLSIPERCFLNCYNLSQVNTNIPEAIGSSGFNNCSKLMSLDFVYTSIIYPSAFTNCINLSRLNLYKRGSVITLSNKSVFNNTPFVNSSISGGYQGWGSIYVPQDLLESYKTNTSWSFLADRFVGVSDIRELRNIKNYEFRSSTISEIPDEYSNVLVVGEGAFMSCFNLASINLQECFRCYVGAFSDCRNLSIVNMPKLELGNRYLFASCSNLTSVNLPTIGNLSGYMFTNCSKLSEVNIPLISKLTTLPDFCFYNCRISSIDLLKCKTIEQQALGYTSLTTISLPNIQTISNAAFSNCTKLSQVIIGTSNCVLNFTNVFNNTPISRSSYLGYFGSIYVPSEYVSAYKTSTNWMTYSDRITSIENLPSEA